MPVPEGNEVARPIRVLLADDDETFLGSLRALIEQQPELVIVGEAYDGLQVLLQVDDLAPDAVVIDLHMPQLDGVSAVARLRRDHSNLCLIAITGDDAPKLHKAVEEAGADAVLIKGELVEGLLERLRALKLAQRPPKSSSYNERLDRRRL
jgi:DNA-binding NarL/FixJ family response regulator